MGCHDLKIVYLRALTILLVFYERLGDFRSKIASSLIDSYACSKWSGSRRYPTAEYGITGDPLDQEFDEAAGTLIGST